MGLDATVYCNCFEEGRLRTPPLSEWKVYVCEDGCLNSGAKDIKLQMAFDAWYLEKACEHENGILVHHRIGNISLIAFLRKILASRAPDFPIILEKILYSGTHCGDFIEPEYFDELEKEINKLSLFAATDQETKKALEKIQIQLSQLLQAASSVHKPIVF